MAQTIEQRHASNESVAARARAYVAEETKNMIEERGVNERAAERVHRYGEAVGAVRDRLQVGDGSRIGSYLDDLASRIDRVSSDLRRQDYREGGREIRRLASDHPEVFLGAAFAAGAIMGRIARETMVERTTPSTEAGPNVPPKRGELPPLEQPKRASTGASGRVTGD